MASDGVGGRTKRGAMDVDELLRNLNLSEAEKEGGGSCGGG